MTSVCRPGPESGIGEIPTSEASFVYGPDGTARARPEPHPSELATEIEALPDVLPLRGQDGPVVRPVWTLPRPSCAGLLYSRRSFNEAIV